MVRSFHRKSHKKASARKESPLMAAEEPAAPPPSPSSLSRLQKDERRVAQRKARDEKRQREDEQRASEAKDAKRKKHRARAAEKKQDVEDARWGRCDRCQTLLVKLVHIFDALLGLACVVYGSLLASEFKEPATAAVVMTLLYGSVLLFASLAGVAGFFSARLNRVGLAVSAYTAPLIVFFYLFMLIVGFDAGACDAFFDYLTAHMDALYLNDAEIDALKLIRPYFYIVLASLAVVEVCRFFLLRHLRVKLVELDVALLRLSESHLKNSKSKSAKKKSAKSKSVKSKTSSSRSSGGGSSRRKSSRRRVLTEPLLSDVSSSGEENC